LKAMLAGMVESATRALDRARATRTEGERATTSAIHELEGHRARVEQLRFFT